MTGPKTLTHRCGDCAHARWNLTPSKKIKRHAGKAMRGLCTMISPIVIIDLPSCVKVDKWSFKRHAVWPEAGTDCPCYEQMLEIKQMDGSEPETGFQPITITRAVSG